MKKVFLFLMGLGALVASCNDNDEPEAQKNPNYKVVTLEDIVKGFKFIEGVSVKDVTKEATADLEAWVKELNEITMYLNTAEEGKAGFLSDGKKKRFVNKNGVETEQLIKKGLIGALQLKNFNKYLMAGVSAKDANARIAAIEGAAKYILGNATVETTRDEYSKSGNSFGKYMMSTNKSVKYAGIRDRIFATVKMAKENAENPKVYMGALMQLNQDVTTVVAFRAVHYMAGYGAKIREQFTGNATHELSEGLGFAYSLQFAFNAANHGFFLSAEEAKAIADVDLWKEAKDKSGKSFLDKEAKRIAKMFGFEVADAL